MRIPKLSLHPSGQYRVRFKGKSIYLGKNKETAIGQYKLLLIEYFGPVELPPNSISVAILLARYCEAFLSEIAPKWLKLKTDLLKQVCEPVLDMYGTHPAERFGPLAFQHVRKRMANTGKRSTSYVNSLCSKLRTAFRWAVSQELVSQQCYDRLMSVPDLKAGQLGLKEGRKVKPVTDAQIIAVLPFLSNRIADIVRLLALTGARPGEVLGMRPVEITKDGQGGYYEPEHHKTEWKNQKRVIRLNAEAMGILNSRWPESPFTYFFPMRWNKTKPLDTQSLKNEIHKACKRAMLPKFNPYQIRHMVLT